MWVITTDDLKCIVKGKSTKSLVGISEPTKKELVTYENEKRAKSAIMRMLPEQSIYVLSLYGGNPPRLIPSELEQLPFQQ